MRASRATTVLALLAVTKASNAQEPLRRIDFSWVRGASAAACATRAEVIRAVRERVGRDPFARDAGVSAEVYVTRGEASWRASLTLRDATGSIRLERQLSDSDASCRTVTDAVIESLVLALDPSPPPRPALLTPSAGPRGMVAPTPPPAPRVEATSRARTSVGVELLLGALPGVAPGLRWRVEIPLSSTHLRLWGAMVISPERRTDAPESHWSFGMTRAATGLCYGATQSARVDLSACGGVTLGLVHGVAHRGSPVDPGNHLWLALASSVRGALHLHRAVAVELSAEGQFALVRNTFVVEGRRDPVFVQSALSLALSLGVEVVF